jgi:hypothetical protein
MKKPDMNTKHNQTEQTKCTQLSAEHNQPYRRPINQLAQTITKGGVVTRIWQNLTLSGDICWKVDQIRFCHHDGDQFTSHSLHDIQISDAVRGLCEAKIWIWKANRGLKRR